MRFLVIDDGSSYKFYRRGEGERRREEEGEREEESEREAKIG